MFHLFCIKQAFLSGIKYQKMTPIIILYVQCTTQLSMFWSQAIGDPLKGLIFPKFINYNSTCNQSSEIEI